MVLHAHEQFGAARVMYQRANTIDPKQFAWPYYLAQVESSLGNRAEALKALDVAARIDATYGPLRLRRAEILLDQGSLDESGREFAALLAEQPKSAAAWYGQGRVRLAVGDAPGAVDRAAAPGKVRRNAPDPIPVSVIGRLAVDRDHAGKGLGADLLSDALRRIAVASHSIGIGAVLVHAKDDAAKGFYLRCAEFVEYPADSRILFLPIETVIAAFS